MRDRLWLMGMGRAIVAGLALVLPLVLAACGDDDASDAAAACDTFKACGGDVVGSWQLDGMCLAGIDELLGDVGDMKGCESFFRGSRLRPEGTFTFGADGMLTTVGASFAFDLDAVVTSACASALAGSTVTLNAAACDSLESNFANNPATFDSASCSFGGGNCACTVTSVRRSLMADGPYSVEGTTLIESGDRSEFCVNGNTLSIRSMTSMGDGTLILHRK